MRYPDEIVEEVRQRSDIVDIVGGYVKLQRKGSSYFGLCPFHSEKSPSFSVSPGKQMYYCFGCQAGGNVFSFIKEYENLTYVEAIQFLAERAGVKLPEVEYSKEAKEREELRLKLLEANREAGRYFYYLLRSPNGEVGMEYFRGRGLSEETMNKFGLGFANITSNGLTNYLRSKGFSDKIIREAGLANFDEKHGLQDKFWNRVMFPIQDTNHKVIGFGGRVMNDAKPKYLNSPETLIFDKGKNLYGLNFAKTSRKNYLILVEGYMDVIALHQAGFTETIASLGTALTSDNARNIKRYTENLYIATDMDGAGRSAALRNVQTLRNVGVATKVISMAPYKDPDEFIKNLGPEEFQRRIDAAENSFLFELSMLEAGYDLKDPDGRTRFLKEVATKLVAFEDEIERESYIKASAEKYGLSYESMKKQVVLVAAQNGGEYKPIERPKSTINSKRDPQDGPKMSQRVLLTWLCEEPYLYDQIKGYVSPADFTEEIYRKVAEWMYESFESGTDIMPAMILNRFEDEESQKICAAVFNTKLEQIEKTADKEKALLDVVISVKRNSIEVQAAKPDQTIQEMMRVLEEKKALEKLKTIHFKLNE